MQYKGISAESLIETAIQAGKAIMEIYAGDFSVTKKDDASPLTLADIASHTVVTAALKELTPDIPVISEEGTLPPYDERTAWTRFWIIDPLDGTKEFVSRNGDFTVNIALVENGEPALGVIHAPAKGGTWIGIRGMGAWRVEQGAFLPLPLESAPRPYTVVASRSHRSPLIEELLEKRKQEHPDLQEVIVGSSLKFCIVAEGGADEYPRTTPTMEWDTAAGHAIATAAGCSVRTFPEDGELTYNKPEMLNPFFIVSRTQKA